MATTKVDSGGPADLAPGTVQCRVVAGRRVLIVRSAAGEWFALGATCSHAGQPLDEARVRGRALLCPHHGARFDLATGQPLGPPAYEGIPSYGIRIADGEIEIDFG